MRKGMKPEVINTDEGKLYGFNLGADFVSEHEWGINKLKNLFGINLPIADNHSVLKTIFKKKNEPKQLIGIDKRTASIFPEKNIQFGSFKIKKKEYWALICKEYFFDVESLDSNAIKHCGLYPYSEDCHLVTAWDEGSFGILVDKEYKDAINELYEAMKRCDLAIMIGGSHAFSNGGLLLIVRSSMTKEEIDKFYEVDVDYMNLVNAFQDTGIEKILKDAGKRYFALSPRWKDESKTELKFWLNPMEQNCYNSGWFTLDELKEWVNNKGPIMK